MLDLPEPIVIVVTISLSFGPSLFIPDQLVWIIMFITWPDNRVINRHQPKITEPTVKYNTQYTTDDHCNQTVVQRPKQ